MCDHWADTWVLLTFDKLLQVGLCIPFIRAAQRSFWCRLQNVLRDRLAFRGHIPIHCVSLFLFPLMDLIPFSSTRQVIFTAGGIGEVPTLSRDTVSSKSPLSILKKRASSKISVIGKGPSAFAESLCCFSLFPKDSF